MAVGDTYVPAGSIYATRRQAIEERFNKKIELTMYALDKVWTKMKTSITGVEGLGPISRDLQIHKQLMTRVLTGVIENAAYLGDFPLYGENRNTSWGDKLYRAGAPVQAYPDPFDGAKPKPYRLTIPMRAKVASIGFTLEEARANVLDPVVGNIIAEIEQGFVDNWSIMYCNSFYQSQNDNYRLSSLGSNTGTGAYSLAAGASTRTLVFSPPSDVVDRFYPGQRVDIFSSTTNRVNELNGVRIRVLVALRDPIANTVTLQIEPDTSVLSTATYDAVFTTTTIGTAGFVVYANQYNPNDSARPWTDCAGINSFMKFANGTSPTTAQRYLLGDEAVNMTTGQALGGAIDVTKHPEFKSMGWDGGGQTLTEHKMRKILDAWENAKASIGHTVDTWVGTTGILRAWQASKMGQEYRERQGQLASLSKEGDDGELVFYHNTKKHTMLPSTWIEYGAWYMLKLAGGNWNRYVPPSAKGMKKDSSLSPSFAPFEFVGSFLNGTQSNQIPYRNADGRVTGAYEMPGDLRMQLAPNQPDGIRGVNWAEDKDFADASNALSSGV